MKSIRSLFTPKKPTPQAEISKLPAGPLQTIMEFLPWEDRARAAKVSRAFKKIAEEANRAELREGGVTNCEIDEAEKTASLVQLLQYRHLLTITRGVEGLVSSPEKIKALVLKAAPNRAIVRVRPFTPGSLGRSVNVTIERREDGKVIFAAGEQDAGGRIWWRVFYNYSPKDDGSQTYSGLIEYNFNQGRRQTRLGGFHEGLGNWKNALEGQVLCQTDLGSNQQLLDEAANSPWLQFRALLQT